MDDRFHDGNAPLTWSPSSPQRSSAKESPAPHTLLCHADLGGGRLREQITAGSGDWSAAESHWLEIGRRDGPVNIQILGSLECSQDNLNVQI
jgi:hypothetical protein